METLQLAKPGCNDLVVEILHSGISTGTEKLFWSGDMPDFPGMGYPLVPGYEAVGEVSEAGSQTGFRAGERVFVPGSHGFRDVHCLFGASAKHVVTPAKRVTRLNTAAGPESVLLALAATARHALAPPENRLPDLIVGHGVLGRLLARLTIAYGGPPPTVWEIDPERQQGHETYPVCAPDDDSRQDYTSIYDASGNGQLLDSLIARAARGGEIVLGGFYPESLSFAYPPAFMRELRIRVAAEWTKDDMAETYDLIEKGNLSLDGLITHQMPANIADAAYPIAFADPACLKMILEWNSVQ